MVLPAVGHAQSSTSLDSLRDARTQLTRDLANLKTARESTRSKKENSFSELQLISRQVVLREELLRTMRREIAQLKKEIGKIETSIAKLENQIKHIQEEFGKLMVVTYKSMHNKSSSFYLLSAKSLRQSFKRMLYFKAISDMQESQLETLRETKAFLTKQKKELEKRKLEKVALAQEEKKGQRKLIALKQEQKVLYDQLKQDEAQFTAQISQTEKGLNQLRKAITKEIQRLTELSKPKTVAEKEDYSTLNKGFSSNKGRLPWPMPKSKGTLTRRFGKQTLPGSGTEIDLQGIDISTGPGQEVRAIFEGKVAQVMPVPGQGKIVIVQHGDYYTVYANLHNAFVTAGEEVEMLQAIGSARTDQAEGLTKVHFQLYKGRNPQNPETWLVKKK